MSNRVFLSIDLDFWNPYYSSLSSLIFIRKIIKLQIPIVVTREHQEVIPYVNSSGCDTLWNVDYHADAVGYQDTMYPREHNWTDFVSWAFGGSYIWRYPEIACYREGLGLTGRDNNPWLKNSCKSWKSMKKFIGLPTEKELCCVKGCSVTLSPDWTYLEPVYDVFLMLFSDFKGLDRVFLNDSYDIGPFVPFLYDKHLKIRG